MVQHNIIAFFSDRGIDKFPGAYFLLGLFSNAFNGVKYLCHTLKYFERPTIKEFPSNKVLFLFLKMIAVTF